jgi:hypothetical protein
MRFYFSCFIKGGVMRKPFAFIPVLLSAAAVVSCSSSGGGSVDQTLSSAPPAAATTDAAATPAAEAATTTVAGKPAEGAALAYADAKPVTPAQCAIAIAAGPPPKPAKGADFGEAVVKDTGKAVGRGAMQMVGGLVGGGLGSAVAGGIAQSTVRSEGDIKGVWTITDGSPNCGCQIGIDGFFMQQGKGNDTGSVKLKGCANPQLIQAAAWALGYSVTGYDAKFELKAKDKKTVVATLNRDGMHYFSGTLADGTPMVMWREGQTYNQLATFK